MDRRWTLLLMLFLCSFYLSAGTVAQDVSTPALDPSGVEACDAADVTRLFNESEASACEVRTYVFAASDTLALHQDRYDSVTVTAWDQPNAEVTMTVVARREAIDDAQTDLSQIRLRTDAGTLQTTGPREDAPGWWSVKYVLRVPEKTTLDVRSENAGIAVREVAGGHRIASKNGSITFTMPKNVGADLQIETKNGDVDFGFPVMIQGSTGGEIRTTVGDGGPGVRLTSTNGDVTVERAE